MVSLSSASFFSEGALGKRHDQAYLDNESHKALDGAGESLWSVELQASREESSPVKSCHARYQGLYPGKMGANCHALEIVDHHESADGEQIGEEAAPWLI